LGIKTTPATTSTTGTSSSFISTPGWSGATQEVWEGYHHGGIVKKHEGGLQRDEVIAKLLNNEYVLRREAAQSIGRQNLDYMNREGKMPPQTGLTINVPVTVGMDDKRLMAHLQSNIEATVTRTVKEFSR
jgi:hypothetical protein